MTDPTDMEADFEEAKITRESEMESFDAYVIGNKITIPSDTPIGYTLFERSDQGDKIDIVLEECIIQGNRTEKVSDLDKRLILSIEEKYRDDSPAPTVVTEELPPRICRKFPDESKIMEGDIFLPNNEYKGILRCEINNLKKKEETFAISENGTLTEYSGDSYDKSEKSQAHSAYVASVSDNLTSNAKQTSSAAECAKYLKELRDVLVESELEGETYEDVMDELGRLITRVDSEGFADELDETRVRQIEDVAHRIERMCQRQF